MSEGEVEGMVTVNNFLKLTIELVPRTSWYNNLRNRMSKESWDKVRKTAYWEHGYRCVVCGVSDVQLHCHEVWEYDDDKHTQTLKGFVALCPMCHHVKHIGLAGILADKGELDFGTVVSHFMQVNSCDKAAFWKYHDEAFALWEARSQYQWTVDLGEYAGMVTGGN